MTPPVDRIEHGTCHCGCGRKTTIAAKSDCRSGWIKGNPLRFIKGHGARAFRVDFTDAAPFKLDGVYCKLISLSMGLYSIVWESDFNRLNQFIWYAHRHKNGTFYAARKQLVDGKEITIPLHREVLGLHTALQADHSSMNTLDNRQCNLRPATRSQQQGNTKTKRHNQLGIKGVREVRPGQFTARIRVNGKEIYLGSRRSAEDARTLYKEAAIRYFGEFARFV